jgi:hypothetical protein
MGGLLEIESWNLFLLWPSHFLNTILRQINLMNNTRWGKFHGNELFVLDVENVHFYANLYIFLKYRPIFLNCQYAPWQFATVRIFGA